MFPNSPPDPRSKSLLRFDPQAFRSLQHWWTSLDSRNFLVPEVEGLFFFMEEVFFFFWGGVGE